MSGAGWFAVRALDADIHLIAEPVHVNSYLVRGERRAVLIDSGMGIDSMRRVVAELTDLEVLVVNTHYHFDHVGGNHEFERIAIHELGAEPLGREVPPDALRLYMAYAQRVLAELAAYRDLDDRIFHFLSAETTPRPFPAGFDPDGWRIVPSVPAQLLQDGDVLDLGGRELRVLHTPGHTPDCISLWDPANGIVFGGDTVSTGPIYAHLPDSDLVAFGRSTQRLGELASEVRTVYVQHYGRYVTDGHLLVEHAEGFRRLLAGEAPLRRTRDCFGFAVQEATFDRFSIFVPDAEAAEQAPQLGGAAGK